jgi:hypothetical protein
MSTHTVKWTLTPPHGVRFVNELGNEVSCQFPIGKEEEVFQTIFQQLNTQFQQALKFRQELEAKQAAEDTIPPPPASNNVVSINKVNEGQNNG